MVVRLLRTLKTERLLTREVKKFDANGSEPVHVDCMRAEDLTDIRV